MTRPPGPPVDERSFERMRRILPNLLAGRRTEDGETPTRRIPEEVAFKLTNRCDLRCTHCYQWSDEGYHHHLSAADKRGDMPLSLIAGVLEATREIRANVYLWGGEPLVYRDWDGLVDLLDADPRWTSICTNGSLIEKRLPSLNRISRQLEVSISIDGFEAEHDNVRGKGSFARTLAGLRALRAAQVAGDFHGQLTVNFVITDPMAERIHDFVAFLDGEGIDTLYVSYPWYIAPAAARRMDRYFDEHYGWERGAAPSWHSYSYKLDPELLPSIVDGIARVDASQFRLQVRYNPRLDGDDLAPFVAGSDKPAQGKTRCQSTRTRMDVFANGDVVSCKFFPEFRVGNLHQSTFAEIWRGERFDRVRDTVARCGLMPICAKCNLLYTRGM